MTYLMDGALPKGEDFEMAAIPRHQTDHVSLNHGELVQ